MASKKSQRTQQLKSDSKMSGNHGLGAIRSVVSFRDLINAQSGLSEAERLQLIEQAEVLIGDLYAHLPLKRSMHSIDPLQRLRLLKQRAGEMSIIAFHEELLAIFKELRDLHTNLRLPAPFGGQIAFLGILIERFFENGQPQYMISKRAEHLVTDPTMVQGVEITHWNGMPIDAAVWRNAEKEAGSNIPARIARGLETLTLRSMRSSLPPDEDWVDITYVSDGGITETRLNWQVFDTASDLVSAAADPSGLIEDLNVPLRYVIGLDERQEIFRQAKKRLFNRSAVDEAERAARYAGRVPRSTAKLKAANAVPTSRPDEITAKLVDTSSGQFGYIRLWTFSMEDGDINAFVSEFMRLLREDMPEEGLILDVRGNGGGYIIAAEFLLQLLTPKHITPEPTQFIATASTLDLVRSVPGMAPWRASLEQAVSTGALFSKAIPLSPENTVNVVGQIYFGPVVLITDAYCYSACDMFAAGFQDHEIGPVLGVDEMTGAGGANVLTHKDLTDDWTGGPLKALPGGAGMRVSLRRTLRVGERSGEPVEDLGVRRDVPHAMTRNDLLNGNADMLDAAGRLLASETPRRFDVDLSVQGQMLGISLDTRNVESFDVYVDDRPVSDSAQIQNDAADIAIPRPPSGAVLRIDGFDGGRHVAARKFTLN